MNPNLTKKVHRFSRILFLGLLFSHLALFGILSFIPFDLMFVAEQNENVWGFIMIFTVIPLSGLILPKLSQKSLKILQIITTVGMILISGLLCLLFLNFSQFNQENWLIQGSWFLRSYGGVWAIYLGFLVESCILQWQHWNKMEIFDEKRTLYLILIMVVFLTMIYLAFYRFATLFAVFTFTFILNCLFGGVNLLFLVGSTPILPNSTIY